MLAKKVKKWYTKHKVYVMLANLLLRTEYSFMQSLCSIKETVIKAKELGYKALAMADFGNLHGGYKFYKECIKNDIKPIIGIEIEITKDEYKCPIILYAMDNFGYQNILKIASRYKINNQSFEIGYLQKYGLGVLGIIKGDSPIIQNRNDLYIRQIKDSLSKCYVGISKKLLDDDYSLLHQYLQKLEILEVAVQDTRYFNEDDIDSYQVLQAVSNNKSVKDFNFDKVDYKFYSVLEYQDMFKQYPYLVDNNKIIVNSCSISIKNDQLLLPEYDAKLNANDYLQALCMKGLEKRLGIVNDRYLERAKKELDTIKKMGFADYFLIVWDYVKYAKKSGILVGPGRGSAPASLVSYALGITDVDPIKHQLLFERFLNIERISMPDIDIDFPDNERDTVIRYVGSRYGMNRVAHIATFGTFQIKSAVRDVAKALELSNIRLEEVLKYLKSASKDLKKAINDSPELQNMIDNYPDIEKVLKIACRIEGLPRNVSTHAAGIIITKYDIVNYTPLDNGLNGIYQTQFEASDLEELGLLKMDFLGLRNLSIIKNCVDMIKKDIPSFELPTDYNDKLTFRMITNGDTTGVFQLESEGMRQTLRQMGVESFEDICSALALYRPGPMEMIPEFINRKKGKEKITYLHKDLENILRPTHGIIVYQDQIMLIAWKFAGYSLGEADVLRRAVSKKKKDVLIKEKNKFISSSMKKGYSKEVAEEIYEYILKFANYGFNKAHSVAYSVIAYLTAFLKCHYPSYYFSVLLNSVIGTNNLLSNYIGEITKRHIKVRIPHINESSDSFKVAKNCILMPLTAIDGLGPSYVNEILKIRNEFAFTDFEDFINRVSDILPPQLIENIIYSGALDSFGLTKKTMIDNYGALNNRKKYSFVKNLTSVVYDTEEFSYGYLLDKELQILGINLKYNFMYQYEGYFRKKIVRKIIDLKLGKVSLLGIVTSIREIKTKNNTKMFFADIKDDTGTIGLTVFPKLYLDFAEVKVGTVLIVTGNLEERNSEKQVIVENFRII